jgi:hypothetical protein
MLIYRLKGYDHIETRPSAAFKTWMPGTRPGMTSR